MTNDLEFSSDPTSRSDEIADYVRQWYEQHRETWFERHSPFGTNRKRGSALADEFMLGLIAEVRRVLKQAEDYVAAREAAIAASTREAAVKSLMREAANKIQPKKKKAVSRKRRFKPKS